MGLDSRDYLRNESYDGDGNYSSPPAAPMSVVTKLVIVTVAVFLLQILTLDHSGNLSTVDRWLILDGNQLFKGQIWRLLTYAFLHSTNNPLHIVMNMYMLWAVGRVTVQLTGPREFVWFYCVSAVFAGMCSVSFYKLMGVDIPVLGASGAVLAVFTLFAVHYPRQKVYLFGVLAVEVRWLLAAFVAYDTIPVISDVYRGQLGGSGTAHSAHLGGLLFGWLYYSWNMRFTNWWDQIAGRAATSRTRKSGLKVYNPKTQPEADLARRVDDILAKISETGEESLSDRERRILRQASEQLKKKR